MIFNKLAPILCILFLLMNCTSKSKQAKLRKEKTVSIDIVKNVKENVDDLVKSTNLFLIPTSTTNQIVKHKYITVSYSEKDEQPEWVYYKVSSENYNNKIKRTNNYRADPFVRTKSASPDDYKGSGYDMGHLAPARAMGYNYTSMSESFYLSNISPQKASFNRGIWKRLESKVEYWSSFRDSIFVVTGPVLDNPIDLIGHNKIAVPRAFYKTLISFKNGEIKGIAFILPNEKSSKSIYSYVTSIDQIEKITGIDFYPGLDNSVQEKVEANLDFKKWMFIK